MKEILENAMQRADSAELFTIKMEKYPVSFSGNRLKSIKSQLSRSISLRIKKDGRLGFSVDSNTDDPEGMVSRALETLPRGPICAFDFVTSPDIASVQLFDPKTVTFEVEDGVEMGQELIDRMIKSAPGTTNDVKIVKYFYEITYMSGDVEKTYYKTLFATSLTNMQITPDGFIYISEDEVGGRIPAKPEAMVDEMVKKLALVKNSYELPSKPTTVIFHPKAMDNLLNPLVAGLSGKNLVSGSSPLREKMGERVLSEKFSLTDDPLMDFGADSRAFDGEGLKPRKLRLFDKGIVSSYLLDLHSAHVLSMNPTGSACRGLASPPEANSSNLIVSTGDTSLEDMIGSMKDGLIVEEVIGGGQSNVIAGEFSLNVSLGFKVKDGKVLGRVRNTMISGNSYDLLGKNLMAVGNKAHMSGSTSTPYVMVKDLSVAGKE